MTILAHSPLECCLSGSFVRWWEHHPNARAVTPSPAVTCFPWGVYAGGYGVTAVTPFFWMVG